MLAKNNGIPIEEFDLNNSEESTSTAHEESQLKSAEVNTDKEVMLFAINSFEISFFNRKPYWR